MLRIYVDEIDKNCNLEVVNNVELEFLKVTLTGSELERTLLRLIEQAEYNDSSSFIDRFGYKLYNSELSTGCKAALCVVHCNDKVINLQECGSNARDIIISVCNNGNILIQDSHIHIFGCTDKIDAVVDNYRFTTVDRLDRYICDERPFEPNMSYGGVSVLR